jgi:hypothetical protein
MTTLGTPRQIEADLRAIFDHFPTCCLEHLRDNSTRLVRGAYQMSNDRGCLMFLLSERLPERLRITDRERLKKFFAGPLSASGEVQVVDDHPAYQGPKWIVRIWDGEPHPERYGTSEPLSETTLIEVLTAVINERRNADRPVRALRESTEAVRWNVRASIFSRRYPVGTTSM